MRRMAAAMGDDAYCASSDSWLEAGAHALEQHLWAGDYYLNFNEPETGQQSDLIFGLPVGWAVGDGLARRRRRLSA